MASSLPRQTGGGGRPRSPTSGGVGPTGPAPPRGPGACGVPTRGAKLARFFSEKSCSGGLTPRDRATRSPDPSRGTTKVLAGQRPLKTGQRNTERTRDARSVGRTRPRRAGSRGGNASHPQGSRRAAPCCEPSNPIRARATARSNPQYQTGEFDPGSERTFAAGLTHASRTRIHPSGWRTVAHGCVTRG